MARLFDSRGGVLGEGKMADFSENPRRGGGGYNTLELKMTEENGDRKCRFLAYQRVLEASFRFIKLIKA